MSMTKTQQPESASLSRPAAAPLPAPVIPASPRRRGVSSVLEPVEPTLAQIRERAYFIYLARGGRPGTPEQDWFQAEQELRAERGLPPKTAAVPHA